MSVFDFLTEETFPVAKSLPAQVAEVGSLAVAQPAAGGGEQLLPASVLAEPPNVNMRNIGGEARESTLSARTEGPDEATDSRGGQNTLCHQKKQSIAITKPSNDGESEIPNDASKSIEGTLASANDGSKNTSQSGGVPNAESDTQPASTSTILVTNSGWLAECEPTLSPESKQKLPSASSSVQTATENTIGEILDQIVAFFRRYVILPMPEQYDLISLWVAHTYVFELFHFTPYLIIRSPEPECGKSTLLGILKLLSHAPWKVVVPTPAVIYRMIEARRPTLLLDEFDTFYNDKIKSEANETLRGTLNAGFERGDLIPRCDGPKNELLEFSPYCPKALAGIGRLPETVESRAFIIPIVRLGHDEHVQEYDEETAPEEARPIAEALRSWAGVSSSVLKKASPSRPSELKPRQRNIAKPLLAIADMAGEEWGDRARHALVRICAKEKLISQGTQLLADIRSIMLSKSVDKITTNELIEFLIRVENANSPWPVLWEGDMKAGKTHSPGKKLAGLLSAFDIHPRPLRFGSDVKKGYIRADFVQSWDRYLEPAQAETAELDLGIEI